MANQIIVSEDRNQITVVEGETRIVEVVTQGPQGAIGPIGPAGPSGSSILNQITSGSVTASVNIGPTIFSLTSGSSTYLSLSSSGSLSVNGDTTIQGNQFNAGTYWRSISGSNFPVAPWRGIAYGNGLFVAIADRGAGGTSNTTSIATSPDGVNWTFRTIPSLTGLTNIIYQNGIFVAVGRVSQRGFYSYDGINWFDAINMVGIVYGATYGKDKFVACKIDNPGFRINVSYDGKTWQGVSTPSTMDLPWTGIAYGDDKYVAVAESNVSGSIAISYDGITWNNVTRPSAGSVTTYNVTYGKGLFVATCDNGKIMTSPDGVNWTVRDTPLTGLIWKCIFAEGVFIAAGAFVSAQNKFIYSTDGITWQVANTPSLNNWGGFAYGNGLLVSVSYNGPDTGSLIVSSGVMNSFTTQNDNRTHGRQIFTDDFILSNAPVSQSSGFKLDVSGSSRFAGNTTITGSLTVTDTITAQRLVVQTITSSTSYITGSTIFGSLSTNTHQFTGSVLVSGSVGIGTNAPTAPLTIVRTFPSGVANSLLDLGYTHTGGYNNGGFSFQQYYNSAQFTISNGTSGASLSQTNTTLTISTQNVGAINTISRYHSWDTALADGSYIWSFQASSAMRLLATGNLLLGLTTDDTINRLQVSGSGRFTGGLVVTGSATITSGLSAGSLSAGATTISGLLQTPAGIFCDNNLARFRHVTVGVNQASGTGFIQPEDASQSIGIRTGTMFGGTQRLLVTSTGLVAIGSHTPIATLDVRGTTFLSGSVTGSDTLIIGSGNTSATNALTVQNSSAAQALSINNAGQAMFGTNTPAAGIKLETDGAFRAWTRVEIGQFGALTINTTQITKGASGSDLFEIANSSAHNAIAGTYYALQVRNSVTPTSGNAVVNGLVLNLTVSQSSATGITRGLYVNPTLTSAWDFRAVEWSNNASATSGSWGLYGSGSAPNYLSGSLNIGTTAIGANALNVSGSTLLRGSGNTSGTNALVVQNSDAVSAFIVRNDGRVSADGTNFVITKYTPGATTLTIGNIGHNDAVGIRTTSATGLIAVSSLGVSTDNLTGASIYAAGGATGGRISLGLISNRALITSAGSGIAMNTSAMLQVDSTSQGFLPPRMTTTQMNAISGAAAGLIVYDSTVNKHYGFDGTTWNQFY